MHLRRTPFDHPDAVLLNERVQREYELRYGEPGGDMTPLDPAMFVPPHGAYFVLYGADGTGGDGTGGVDGTRATAGAGGPAGAPLATGGWRAHEATPVGHADGDAEIKRMYVVPEARGRGLSRLVLAALEDDARLAGRTRMVLETGTEQPEAIALYESSGYAPCVKFGLYRDDPKSRCYAKPLTPAPQPPAAPSATATSETTETTETAESAAG